MWLQKHKNMKSIPMICLLVFLTMVNLASMQFKTTAQEKTSNKNMRQILESVNAKIEAAEAPFEVTFKFVQPLRDNNEVFWSIPYSSEEDDIDRWISEIGDDFICFYERGGSSVVNLCTPFSNIVLVGYLEP